jgi:hypothetical protein
MDDLDNIAGMIDMTATTFNRHDAGAHGHFWGPQIT